MTTTPLLTALPYHRMAHYTGRHRWWRPLIGTVVVLGGWVLLTTSLYVFSHLLGSLAGYPEQPDGTIEFGPLQGTVLDLTLIALALPLVLLAVRWTGRRPAGTVSSVTGRLRGRWLAWCLLAALPALGLLQLGVMFLPMGDVGAAAPEVWVGWHRFLLAMAVLVVFVPLQAAAEEYVFRGWLMQAVGGVLRSPWCAALPQAALFAAAHGWGTVWGFVDLLFFGLVTGWLTIRTGGLEAAIALHVLSNLMAFGLAASVVDGLSSDATAADAPWQLAALDMVMITLFAVIVLWLARRHRPVRISPSAVPPAEPGAPVHGVPSPLGVHAPTAQPHAEPGPFTLRDLT